LINNHIILLFLMNWSSLSLLAKNACANTATNTQEYNYSDYSSGTTCYRNNSNRLQIL